MIRRGPTAPGRGGRAAPVSKEGVMNRMQAWQRVARGMVIVTGLVALLGGCVVYPIEGGGGHRHYYWHDRDWR